MSDSVKEGFVPRVAEEPKVAPVAETPKAKDAKPEEKKPEPKAVAQVIITAFDTAPLQVHSSLMREETLLVLKAARKVVAGAIAEEN